jgi:hypothetical protein
MPRRQPAGAADLRDTADETTAKFAKNAKDGFCRCQLQTDAESP